jgi:hypothetical protein
MKIRDWFVRRFRTRRIAQHGGAIQKHAVFLKDMHARYLTGSDFARFAFIWCEIAAVCERSPDAIRVEEPIAVLCPSSSFLGLIHNPRLDDLEYLIMLESRALPPPEEVPKLVMDVLRYLVVERNESLECQ